MATEGFKRKLTAIFSADVIGYSRLMRDDEEATVRDLTAHRVLITQIIQQHNGRVVDSPGDNILAEFASVVDAVNGAIKIQEEIKKSNTDTPRDRRMEFRIGINLGDVIEEEGRIYGDGVNIAARIEGLAAVGGIAISGTVYEHIKEKLSLGYHYLGEQDVKNISEPVRVYQLLTTPPDAGKMIGEEKPKSNKLLWAAAATIVLIILSVCTITIRNYYFRPSFEPASIEKMAFPLPEKPSIAVLPFDNMSGDPEQDYIADGISENIISDLSKISEMFVIARNSTFTYKGKPVKVQQVSEELGVRYILEGSTQKIGDRLRITAQLIDATTGHHLWSEKYDRYMKDFFALQDEITHKIIVELQVKLTEGEQARISHKSTTNLEAWSYAVRGLKLFERASKENNAKAMEFFEKAVELDPDYTWAWVRLAWTHVTAAQTEWGPYPPSEHLKKLFEISEKVLALDESDSDVLALLGLVYRWRGKYEQSIIEGEKSLILGPTNAQAHVLLAVSMNIVGRFDEAIELVKKAMRLHPYYPAYYLPWLGSAYRMTGRYEDALKVYDQLLDRSRTGEYPNWAPHLYLAEIYAELGKEDEARIHVEQVIKLEPGFSLENANKISTFKFKNPTHLEHRLKSLRKAGFPEHPPLQLPDKPSIAVLAFDNLSGDPEQEYFSDGIAENIITALSKVGELFVIARNSSFTYKGKPVKVQQIGRELGVRYVLEGSVQKSGDRIRITAQLIDAQNGQHLWAENYDRELKDIFEIQDEITLKIVTALRVELTEGEQAHVWAKQVKNLDVYLKAAQWKSARGEGTKRGILRCGQLAKEIIEIEPDDPIGYRLLGWYYWQLAMRNISPMDSIEKGLELTKKALAMDESDELSHAVLGHIYLKMKNYEKAIESGKRSVDLSPNGAMVHTLLGRTLCDAEQLDEGIASIKQGLRLNPFPDYWYYTYLGNCYNQKGQYEDALTEYKKALQRAPEAPQIHGFMAVTYILLGREEEARASAARSMELAPWVTVDIMSKILTFKNTAFAEKTLSAMRKAGFPE